MGLSRPFLKEYIICFLFFHGAPIGSDFGKIAFAFAGKDCYNMGEDYS